MAYKVKTHDEQRERLCSGHKRRKGKVWLIGSRAETYIKVF